LAAFSVERHSFSIRRRALDVIGSGVVLCPHLGHVRPT